MLRISNIKNGIDCEGIRRGTFTLFFTLLSKDQNPDEKRYNSDLVFEEFLSPADYQHVYILDKRERDNAAQENDLFNLINELLVDYFVTLETAMPLIEVSGRIKVNPYNFTYVFNAPLAEGYDPDYYDINVCLKYPLEMHKHKYTCVIDLEVPDIIINDTSEEEKDIQLLPRK